MVRETPLYFYVPIFRWKYFLMGRIRKIQKKKEGKNGGKKKKRFLGTWSFPYLYVLHRLGTHSGGKKQIKEGKNGGKKKKRFLGT